MAETIQWEYRSMSLGSYWTRPKDEDVEAALNELGEDGWEVISLLAQYGSKQVRAVGHQRAAKTVGLVARTASVFPQDMGWANEPMFMGCIELHGLLSIRLKLQRFCTDERHVVKMNNVIGLTVQDLQDSASLQTRVSGLLSNKRR